jgi:hypothetical protein
LGFDTQELSNAPTNKNPEGLGPVSVEARELVHLYLSICHGMTLVAWKQENVKHNTGGEPTIIL